MYKYQIKKGHQQMAKMVGIVEPPDGFTDEERMIAKIASEHTVGTIYKSLPTARLKAIAAMTENGYPQETIAFIFDISQERVQQEINTIKLLLSGGKKRRYTFRREDPRYPSSKKLGVVDILSILHSLVE